MNKAKIANLPHAWMCLEDGEITTSVTLAENWERFGHQFMALTEQQYREVLRSHLVLFGKETP